MRDSRFLDVTLDDVEGIHYELDSKKIIPDTIIEYEVSGSGSKYEETDREGERDASEEHDPIGTTRDREDLPYGIVCRRHHRRDVLSGRQG